MRFDEFIARDGVAVSPVDQFDGLAVDVGVPADWDPFDSAPGIGVWMCRHDPRVNQFCPNAVLTLHRVEAPLDAADVFACCPSSNCSRYQAAKSCTGNSLRLLRGLASREYSPCRSATNSAFSVACLDPGSSRESARR
ncbi:LpqN/LpqT family lipoprotein [Mycolicibacter algericus]|uniref:LpqN/LpqT family lipoprotein n=1 Tax=Mycolicibacter algericus TaxID=1288388 RepID=UPI003C74CA8A